MGEISLAVRIDTTIHRLAKMRAAEHKVTLKDYIIYLIINDAKEKNTINLESVPAAADIIINEETVKEAQKVLDFASRILEHTAKYD
jgi:hypothetical protein